MKEFRRSFLVRDRLKESVFERCVEVAFEEENTKERVRVNFYFAFLIDFRAV